MQRALFELSSVVRDIGGETLWPKTLVHLRALDLAALPHVRDKSRIGPCVAGVGKIVCVGNYADHAAESSMPIPAEPILFLKATSSIVGPNDDVEIPRARKKRTDNFARRQPTI